MSYLVVRKMLRRLEKQKMRLEELHAPTLAHVSLIGFLLSSMFFSGPLLSSFVLLPPLFVGFETRETSSAKERQNSTFREYLRIQTLIYLAH